MRVRPHMSSDDPHVFRGFGYVFTGAKMSTPLKTHDPATSDAIGQFSSSPPKRITPDPFHMDARNRAEIERLKDRLRSSEEDSRKTVADYKWVHGLLNEAEKERDTAEDQRDMALKELEAMRQERDQAQYELGVVERDLNAAQRERDEARDERDEAEQELRKTRTALDTAVASDTKHRTKVRTLRARLSETGRSLNREITRTTRLEGDLKSITRDHDQQLQTLVKARDSLRAALDLACTVTGDLLVATSRSLAILDRDADAANVLEISSDPIVESEEGGHDGDDEEMV
uniref:Uncharacterized protein n=1 Tax=Mycena chlorophos TaxID=658473 RepID=A0ABQ0LIY2_MYCCL|nr:predicted protein [Mycena chlorophos]